MFDGEQFHQFIAAAASRTPPPLPISLSFPLHGSPPPPPPPPPPATNFFSFDPILFPHPHHHHHQQQQQNLLQSQFFLLHHHHHTPPPPPIKQEIIINTASANTTTVFSPPELGAAGIDPWSNEEVLALLRIKSNLDNWFPDFTWEHVSRKLAEVGYKRSAQKCREKFEEEACRNFNSSIEYNKSSTRYLISDDQLDEQLYHPEQQNHPIKLQEQQVQLPPAPSQDHEEEDHHDDHQENQEERVVEVVEGVARVQEGQDGHFCEVLPPEDNVDYDDVDNGSRVLVVKSKKRKRRKSKKFEMFKGLCVEIVNRMMAQQEEMHKKLLENMAYCDEQKFAREEAWKREEMERANKEIELRQQEQIVSGDRQSMIIEFLKKFTSDEHPIRFSFEIKSRSDHGDDPLTSHVQNIEDQNVTHPSTTEIPKLPPQNQESGSDPEKTLSKITPPKPAENPSSVNPNSASASGTSLTLKDDIGKRWPREEVLALINMRCTLYNMGGGSIDTNDDKEGGGTANTGSGTSVGSRGGSLWERISQGMLELGYNRSAKRCKEKWENINKYFRKTKDVNKKRSLDSRTCPYFQQLSNLYNQGKLATPHTMTIIPPTTTEEKCSTSSENVTEAPETNPMGSTRCGSKDSASNMNVHEEGLTFEF